MLTDEDVIRIKRIKDCFTKLIELNRTNFIINNKSREMHKVFGNIYTITNMEEKIIYLLCVYAVNSDENVMVILNDIKAQLKYIKFYLRLLFNCAKCRVFTCLNNIIVIIIIYMDKVVIP